MTTYTTKQGDMWDSIAHTQCGNAKAMTALILANQQYADIYILPAGIVLNIPEIDQKPVNTQVPPWKKVVG